MLVANVNFHIILPVWYEGTRFTTEVWVFWLYSLFDVKSPHREHLKNTLDTRFKLSCLFVMWTSRFCFLFCMKSLISHLKHFQDTLDTEFKLSCLFLMWTFRSYFQFDLKSHFHTLNFRAFYNMNFQIFFYEVTRFTLEAFAGYFRYWI